MDDFIHSLRHGSGVLAQIQKRRQELCLADRYADDRPCEHFLESAIQLGWLDGLGAERLSRQPKTPRDQVESGVGAQDHRPARPTQLEA